MLPKGLLAGLFFWWADLVHAFINNDPVTPKSAPRVVSTTDVMTWGLSLLVVLGVFFLCVWALRKLGGANLQGSGRIRLLGGLSLGLRERVILLQIGEKQLVLGVTPGRIETLLVLEGEDCLQKEAVNTATRESGFAQKLAQAFRVQSEGQRSEPS